MKELDSLLFTAGSKHDVVGKSHVVSHELLENYAHSRVEVGNLVATDVYAVQSDAPLSGVVESEQQLDDG